LDHQNDYIRLKPVARMLKFFAVLLSVLKHSTRKETILLKYQKISLNIDLKIILWDHQNNYIELLSV